MSSKKFDFKGSTLTFEFENEAAANHFKHWLCGQGEQDYWIWQEAREDEEDGDITGVDFDYWNGNTVKVKCGRKEK